MLKFKIFRSVFIYGLTNGIAAGLPLLLLPVLTRILTPEDYGIVAMYSVVITALGAMTGLSVHGAVGMRYFDRDSLDFPAYVGSCIAILCVSTAVVMLAVWLFLNPLQEFTKLPGKWLLAAVIVSGFQFVLLTQLSIYQSAKRAVSFGALRAGQAVVDASVSLVLVLFLAMSWQGRLSGISLGIGIAGCIAFLAMIREGFIKFRVDPKYVKSALKFGIPLIPHVTGGMLIAMVDRFMITNLIDVGSTGIYMVAVQIGLGLYLIADSCNRAISPWFIEALKANDPERDILIVRMSVVYFLVLLLFAVCLGLAAPGILSFLVGVEFRNAAPLVMLIAVGQAFGGIYLVIANSVFYSGKTASLAFVTLTSGCLNIALSYWLLQANGLPGASQAYVVAQIALCAGTFFVAQKARPLPWLKAFIISGK